MPLSFNSYFNLPHKVLRLPAFIWLGCLLLAITTLTIKFLPVFNDSGASPIETNILKLLPQNQQDPLAQKAFDQLSSEMEDRLLFLIKADNDATAISAASEFTLQLNALTWINKIQGKISQAQQQAWGNLLAPYRSNLLTPAQQQRLTQSPNEQLNKVLQAIYNPFAGVTGNELSNDPFLLFREYLQSLSNQLGQFKVNDGFLISNTSEKGQTHSYVLVTASLVGSPYSPSLQSKLPQLEHVVQMINQQRFDGKHAQILHTGVFFYAAFGTQSAKSEISTIGLGSLFGIILLLLMIYRSTLPLTLALISIGSGMLCSLAVTLAIFDKVHLFSLVFGISLIGVSIDYAFHYLTDRLVSGSHWDPIIGLKHIFVAITLGLITSLIGYLSMLVAPFPGMQQLAVFSATGLAGAYLTVVCWYPFLAASQGMDRPIPLKNQFSSILQWWQNPKVRYLLPYGILITALFGLLHVEYNDDIRQLQALPKTLKMHETEIKSITGMGSTQQMLLIRANNEQSLLSKLAQTSKQLHQLKSQNALANFTSLSSYIPPSAHQYDNFQLVNEFYQSHAETLAGAIGMKNTPIPPAEFIPLNIEAFLSSTASSSLRFLWLGKDQNGQYGSIILLSGLSKPAAIKSIIEDQADISFLDKADEVSVLFGKYRLRMTELLLFAFGLIFILLAMRYQWHRAYRIMLPTIIAAIAGLAVTSLTGLPLNLFNLLALILILGIGIDYSLFFAELGRRGNRNSLSCHSTLLAISLSAITTILSFGLLSLSKTAAIHSFGITVLAGIMVAWLLAPLAMENIIFRSKK